VQTRQTGSNLSKPGNVSQSRYSVHLSNKPTAFKFRDDDEVELTNEITGPGRMRSKGNDEEFGGNNGHDSAYPMSDIHVTKDITWTSAHSDEHKGSF